MKRIRRENGANQFLSQSDSDSDTSSQYVNINVVPLIDVSNCIPCILLSVNDLHALEETPPCHVEGTAWRNLGNRNKNRLQPGRMVPAIEHFCWHGNESQQEPDNSGRGLKVSSSIDIVDDGWNIERKDTSRIRHISNVHVENRAMILTNGWVSNGRQIANRYSRRATYMR